MNKILFGLAFAAMMAGPIAAQDYRKNFAECTKELGLPTEPGSPQKLSDGHRLHRWTLHSEAQEAADDPRLAFRVRQSVNAAS